MTYVGHPLARREDERFLTGRARYLDDYDPSGVLHVAFARSYLAHARLGGVDVDAASDLPGVVAVLTGADLAGVGLVPGGSVEDGWTADARQPPLAREKVRYVGEPVALVVAETRAQAEDAAELVLVDYEPLDPVLDPRDPSGPLLHEQLDENTLLRWQQTHGDVDAAFAASDRVVARSFRIPRVVAAPMEPRGLIAEHDAAADLLTILISAQDPYRPQAGLAEALGRPLESVRVVLPDVGGAFGSKGAIGPEVVAVAAAALRLGGPLKWAEDRYENFVGAYQGRGVEADVELAVSADGDFLGLRARIYADLGAYLYASTARPAHTTAMLMTGTYVIPAAAVDLVGAATTKVPTGPYRGAGRPEAAYLIERMVDEAARELALDPIELRRRNLIPHDAFPYETPMGWTYDSGDFERCLDRALELAELDRWRAERDHGRRIGIGVSMLVERCGGQWESASVRLEEDGRVVVHTGSSPHGQGHETTFAQIVADELGVDPAQVEVRWGDTLTGPEGVGTFASRSTAMGGSAILEAARELKATGTTEAEARFSSGLLFSSGAYVAVVEIDEATGVLDLLRLVAVDDAGRIVNPLLAHGQVIGATAQGLGAVLVEEVVHDDSGQPVTASFADYGLLTAWEVPEVAADFIETPSPLNPLGAKGIGESGSIGSPAAVGNAVADALGGRHVDPPFTEEKLWEALRR
jgi:carbon-monoxide dehydrogenase large subunit